jgi:hypothetical protein
LAPDNIAENLAKVRQLRQQPWQFWLDMESGVRSDNHFDFQMVERVLQTAYSVAAYT